MRAGTYLAVGLLLALALLAGAAPGARAALLPAAASPLTGGITGPADVGTGLKGTYLVSASGGPAQAANGTQVGTYTFKASLSAANTSGASLSTTSGVLTNFSVSIQLIAPNVTEPLTIFVLVTSTYQGTNASQNFSFSVTIVEPYRLSAQLVVGPTAGVTRFELTVLLDGAVVGNVTVPTLAASATYPVTFAYVNPDLAAGWHTFSVSLAKEHGLVAFAGGAETVSQSFYVPGPPADNTFYYLLGAVAFVGVFFIWSMRVGARRRRPKK